MHLLRHNIAHKRAAHKKSIMHVLQEHLHVGAAAPNLVALIQRHISSADCLCCILHLRALTFHAPARCQRIPSVSPPLTPPLYCPFTSLHAIPPPTPPTLSPRPPPIQPHLSPYSLADPPVIGDGPPPLHLDGDAWLLSSSPSPAQSVAGGGGGGIQVQANVPGYPCPPKPFPCCSQPLHLPPLS
jgi:hypothetical protein